MNSHENLIFVLCVSQMLFWLSEGMCIFNLVWQIAGCSVSVLLALSVGACHVAVLLFSWVLRVCGVVW
jgi:hypothetical protein